jgi:hypothetical protein
MPQEYLTIPAFESYPFGFAACEADAAAFRRRIQARLSSSDRVTIAIFSFWVKKMYGKALQDRSFG